jgi:Alginate export
VRGEPDQQRRECTLAPAWLAVLGFLIAAPASMGQTDLGRFDRQLQQIERDTRLRVEPTVPAEQRAFFDYGAYATFGFAAIDDPGQNTHILRQTDLNAYARLNIDNVHDVFVRVLTRYRDFNAGDSFDGKGDDLVEPRLERAIYKFDLARAIAAYEGERSDFNLVVQGGRQLVHWANGLVLSQDLDGVLLTASYDKLSLQGLAGVTRDSNFDIDTSRPGFDGDTRRGFFGGMLSYQVTPEHRPYVYGLAQRDWNKRNFDPNSINDPTSALVIPTRFHYDSYYVGLGSNGNWGQHLLYAIELAYEGGEGYSNSFDSTGGPIRQSKENIDAYALDARMDYLFQDANNSRASAELILASGDNDRLTTTNTFGGNRAGTNDTAFNGFGLLNTGLAFAPHASNLVMLRGGVATFPLPKVKFFERLQVGIDLFLFGKLDSSAPIDEPTGNDFLLGVEPDLYANWQITSDVSLAVRYGVFFPGSTVAGDGDARHFFYTGVTFGF